MSDVTAPPGATQTVIHMTDDTDIEAILRARLLELIREGSAKDAVAALPRKLSPSRASEFKKCPQLFFYKTICGIETPQTAAALRGTISHYCFERIFDHPVGERTPDLAVTYIEPAWKNILEPDLDAMETDSERERAVRGAQQAREAITPGSPEEAQLLADAEACVRSWFNMERVNNFTPRDLTLPDGSTIDGREFYVLAQLTGVEIHGFIDRLDRFETKTGDIVWSVSDYKTSAVAPWLKKKYPQPTVDRIKKESFFQLRVYAAALWLMFGIPVGMLRLVYVATGDRENGIGVEYVNLKTIEDTITELERIWKDMGTAARTGRWETKTGPLCNWCHFQSVCPAWAQDIADIALPRSG